MTQKYGDTDSIEILRKHNQIVPNSLGLHAGKEVKHTVDGIMACYSSASKCVTAAMDRQQGLSKYRSEHPDLPINVQIGINSGEPVTEDGDFFGAAVQLCARLTDLSEPDQILASSVVKHLCIGKVIPFEDVGKVTLKGCKDPVEIAEVIWNT